ncbi:MAG TPA: phosphatase [Candidatus Latescibacteria bacterium]|nr:phosphatase [Gemmatimonadota bacterium]HCR17670.1 phosphatase [Candidatus Latescibacterota bacterium]
MGWDGNVTISRRFFLKSAAAASLGFNGLHKLLGAGSAQAATESGSGYGKLMPDPEGILDLPKGFSWKVISQVGEKMDDGYLVPGLHDGMAAFPGLNGRTILVRNHELNSTSSPDGGPFGKDNALFDARARSSTYDQGQETPCLGGTTTLVYDTRAGSLERHYLSLSGTLRNCAGGPTPWNTWVSCEETVEKTDDVLARDHGYNFEVPAVEDIGLVEPVPLTEMGRFNHEAIAVDPNSGIVYQTEDRSDGLIYRFIPDKAGKLADGGKLQALALRGHKRLDTRNHGDYETVLPGKVLEVEWIDMDNVLAPEDDLRYRGYGLGAAQFARGEGMWYGQNAVYFACTSGGKNQKGQIWRYVPSLFEGKEDEERSPGTLELFVEPNDSALVENADTLTVSPWGDLVICEDGQGDDGLVGVTPSGDLYKFGRNAMNESEFAGATFSPDGSTLFVNIQSPGLTLAITGPWRT